MMRSLKKYRPKNVFEDIRLRNRANEQCFYPLVLTPRTKNGLNDMPTDGSTRDEIFKNQPETFVGNNR